MNSYAEGRTIQCRKLLKHNNNAKFMEHGTHNSHHRDYSTLHETVTQFTGVSEEYFASSFRTEASSEQDYQSGHNPICVLIQFCWCFCVRPVTVHIPALLLYLLCMTLTFDCNEILLASVGYVYVVGLHAQGQTNPPPPFPRRLVIIASCHSRPEQQVGCERALPSG